MDKVHDNVSTRLARYLGYKQIPKSAFEVRAGFARGTLRSIGDAPHKGTVARIRDAAPDLNIGWLLTGEGSMLLPPDTPAPETEVQRDIPEPDLEGAGQRISALIDALKEAGVVHSQSHFADLIGYGRATISQVKTGRIRTPLAVLLAVSEAFPAVSLRWLLYGTGEMMDDDDKSASAETDPLSEIASTLADIRDLLSRLLSRAVEQQ